MTPDAAVRTLRATRMLADYLAAAGYQAELNDHQRTLLTDYERVEAAYGNDDSAFDLVCQEAGLRPSDVGLLHGAASWRRQQEGSIGDA